MLQVLQARKNILGFEPDCQKKQAEIDRGTIQEFFAPILQSGE